MPKNPRVKSKSPGVYHIQVGKDKVYYISYRKEGKLIEEKVGSQILQQMTPAKASLIRANRLSGKELSNSEKREKVKQDKDAYLNRWTINLLWQEYSTNKLTHKSIGRENSVFNRHISPTFGEKEPLEIAALDVDRYKMKLLKGGLKEQTVKNILEMLRRLTNYGQKKGLCSGLSFSIEMPRPNNLIDESLKAMEIQAVLEEITKSEIQLEALLMKVILLTGRRTGEICKLIWADIDFAEQSILLRDTKTNQNEIVPLADAVLTIFETMPRFHKTFVFPNMHGQERKTAGPECKRIMLRAGIPRHYRPTYCLRHTFASVSVNLRIPSEHLKILIGHKRVASDITARYAHIRNDLLQNSVNEIAKAILKEPATVISLDSKRETEQQ